MKREDEIRQYCLEQGFPQGACSSILEVKAIVATEAIKWADKTMLERMLKYLKVEHPTFFEHFGEEIRKAMEE